MGKPGESLDELKKSYRNARDIGDKEEEAKWANKVGNEFKERGEYITALQWIRKDYEISSTGSNASDARKLMPACQSMGEVYFRLQDYDEALIYQLKHFRLAEEAGDLLEQQRASTQLGRTYMELYEGKERLSALTEAKAYFQTSLDLACSLRGDQTSSSAFVIEQVDAYNNLGLARTLAEDFTQAYNFYSAGLKICDVEEVEAKDAARSRIHHNLGRHFAELREWDKAKFHTEMDIEICQKIPHAQGEAKGWMNLATLYFKFRDYDQATACNKRALNIAQALQDEDNLCSQIKSNMEIVGQARAKSKTFDTDMKKLSKLRRDVESSKGTGEERKYMKQECKLLLELTGRAEELQAWDVHLGLAKRLKRLTTELGDNERLGDALEIVASSYYNLRQFRKSMKWHLRSFELCKRIGHLEGQIVSKINYGNALDASGKAEDALEAYQEAFEAAKSNGSGKMLTQQISALNNIHYSYFVRLNRLEDARKVELQLKELDYAKDTPKANDNDGDERCSETGSEGSREDCAMPEASISLSDEHPVVGTATSRAVSDVQSQRSKLVISDSDSDDDNAPLSSLRFPIRKRRPLKEKNSNISQRPNVGLPKQQKLKKTQPIPDTQLHAVEVCNGRGTDISGPRTRTQHRDRRKRVVSDDEMSEASLEIDVGRTQPKKPAREPNVAEDSDSERGVRRRIQSAMRRDGAEHVNLSSEEDMPISSRKKLKRPRLTDIVETGVKRRIQSSTRRDAADHVNLSSAEDILTSRKKLKRPSSSSDFLRSPIYDLDTVPGTCDNDFISAPDIHLPVQTNNIPEHRSTASARALPAGCSRSVKVPPPSKEILGEECTPRSNFPMAKDADKAGPAAEVPFIAAGDRAEQLATCDSTQLDNFSSGKKTPVNLVRVVEDMRIDCQANISKPGSPNNPLLECYLTHCTAATITPNSMLVERLHSQKVSEEVVVAGCNIQDNDARPLLAALGESDAFSLLDMSHNLLGNATVHAVQELIKSTNQTDLGLTLDLHCNKLGAGALLQICRCPVSLSRLEVLNLSGNRLTDAAARHLSKILKESQALAALNLESCALTTRSIKQLTSALHPESSLTKLCIGKNNPIAGFAIQELLHKLSELTSFSELDMKCLELDDAAVAGVSTLLQKSKSISALIVQATDIHNDGALALADSLDKSSLRLAKLDISLNGFNMEPAAKLCSRLLSIHSLSNLNLSGNSLDEKAAEVMAQGLAQTSCRLKALDLSKCHLGQASVLLIMQGLKDQASLLDLNLAENMVRFHAKLSQPDYSALIDGRSLEVSEGQAESSSVKQFSTKITESDNTEGNCLSVGAEGAEIPENSHHSKAPSIDCCAGEQPREERTVRNVHGDTAESGLKNLRDGNLDTVVEEPDRKEIRVDDPDCIQPLVLSGRAEPESGTGAAEPILTTAEFRAEGVMESVSDRSRWNGEPIQPDAPEVDYLHRKTDLGFDLQTKSAGLNVDGWNADSSSATSAQVFCEQLAASIRMAKGLRHLDLSNNELGKNDVDLLYLAWSACPRGSSDHQQHVDGTIVHFFMQGRPCICADPPCCASH